MFIVYKVLTTHNLSLSSTMRLAQTFLLAAGIAHVRALPRGVDRNESPGSLSHWASSFHSVWDAVRSSALGWYDVGGVFDQLEESFYAPDKSVYQWLSDNPKCVSYSSSS